MNTNNIGGLWCTAFGYRSLINNTGNANSANGYESLFSNTYGNYNTANGRNSLYSNTNGSGNTASGSGSLEKNTIGSWNTAIGYSSLNYNTTGGYNVAVGHMSLRVNTQGEYNTALGALALSNNGTEADANLDQGNRNTAVGQGSMYTNTKGGYNTALGVSSLFSNTNGFYNAAIGYDALQANIDGNNNTALGLAAGYSSLGSNNVFLGYRAGYSETRSDQFYISNGAENAILYGNFSTGQLLVGKADPAGYVFNGTRILNVLGGILTDSIRVALSGNWADHVFADTYKLKPLNEVEDYINTNKHLPGIPTQTEVKEAGINIVEMNARLLEKIEELTLYVIAQQKQIDDLRNKSELKK